MTPDLGESGEERPYWSAAGRGREEVPDGSIIVTPPPVSDYSARGTGFIVCQRITITLMYTY